MSDVLTEDEVIINADQTQKFCIDYDEDCEDIQNKLWCRLYDLTTGKCPYLRHRFL